MASVAFVAGVDEAAAAGAAADRALEIVLVLAVALASETVCLEDGLDLIKEILADETWMASLVLLAAVADGAGVVGA
ncbi:MAG TPA: hypothetical protein VG147_08030 [Solirubrobacteraceae bacterium]|nr:hypothetical protein [Solirubrobacteraceae bacterium]